MTISFSGAAATKQKKCPVCSSVGTIIYWKMSNEKQTTLMGGPASGELVHSNPKCTKCGTVFPYDQRFKRK
jgi:ribosomal protein S27AE